MSTKTYNLQNGMTLGLKVYFQESLYIEKRRGGGEGGKFSKGRGVLIDTVAERQE